MWNMNMQNDISMMSADEILKIKSPSFLFGKDTKKAKNDINIKQIVQRIN